MDIAKIQKLNNLAVELKKHNVVFTKEDAVSHAEGIYGKENNFSNENNSIAEERFDNGNELRKDIRKLTFALKNAMLEIKDLKAKVGKLDRELNDVRVNNRPRPQKKVRTEVPVEEKAEKPKPKTEQLFKEIKTEKKKQELNRANRDNFSNDDVSIEKFFYYGEK